MNRQFFATAAKVTIKFFLPVCPSSIGQSIVKYYEFMNIYHSYGRLIEEGKGGFMIDEKQRRDSIETAISLRLLEMLLRNGIINRSTYKKVAKCYKRKEAA